jgi:homoserine O-succinyltransferase
MPIKIPNDLPARRILAEEGVEVIRESDAVRQDIRPMRIALLNLMPDKIRTETQIARVVGSTPLQVEMTLLNTDSYKSKNVPERHLIDFYHTWDEIRHEKFDGLIVTGAPIETLPFEAVDYWDELTAIFDWAQSHVFRSFHLCWGAQAALHHFHGVPKYELERKMFGIFRHHIVTPGSNLLRGFNDEFSIPVSRHTEVRREDIPDKPGLVILAESPEAGLCLMEDRAHRAVYMFNHLEYDADTLKREYERDLAAGAEIQLPRNYFPDDDPSKPPVNHWRSYAHLLFWNWIYEIYENTPYDISEIGSAASAPLEQTGS